MPNLNRVMLMGNLTRDPETKYTPKGLAIVNFGIAVNRVWSNEAGEKQEEVTFVDIDMFGRKAEVVGEYFKKGHPIYVEGRLKLDTWDDKQTGKKMYKLHVIGENFEFLRSKSDNEESQERPERQQRKPNPPSKLPPADPDLDPTDDDFEP